MKRIAIACALALSLGACSSAQLANFQAGLNNFETGVASVNQVIAATDAKLAANCNSIQATAAALANLASVLSNSSTVRQTLAAANNGLLTWCQAPPQDINSAIITTAAIVVAVKQGYQAAKAGN
jgi:hypothetical protein